MVNVGIIGAGRIGRTHTKALSMLPNTIIQAIADPVIENLEEYASSMNIQAYYRNYTDILNDKNIDAVFICTPSDTHYQLSLDSLSAGKHTFCEKPVDLDIKRVKDIQNKIHETGLLYMVSFQRRFDKEFIAMKKAIDENKIGTIELVEITSRDPFLSPIEWIKSSGGIFCDFTIHDIDMIRFLTNQSIRSVYAIGNALIDPKVATEGHDVDTVIVSMELENGALAVVTNSRRATYGYDQRAEVHGSEGCIMNGNNHLNNTIFMGKNGIIAETLEPYFLERYIEAFTKQTASFIHSIEHKTAVPTTLEDALNALVVAKAADISLLESRKVFISELI